MMMMGFPTFLVNVVIEKERKLIEMMKINGLNMNNYWAVNYVFNFLYYILSVFILIFTGRYVIGFKNFVDTDLRLQLAIYLGWGLAQISYAFFLSVFFSRTTVASISSYMLSAMLLLGGAVLSSANFAPPATFPWLFYAFPHLVFVRAMNHMVWECLSFDCYKDMYELRYSEAVVSIVFLYLHAFVWMVLAWYCNQVVPQSYGVPKPWNFLCLNKRVKKFEYNFDEIGELEEEREQQNQPIYDYKSELEDADSKTERNIVYNLDKADYFKYPLIIKDIRKEYPALGGRELKIAVKNFTLRVKKGEMLGLLGPNGAGKTTLLSMLTGMY